MKYYKVSFAIFGFLSVALGAFAAHGLKQILDASMLQVFHTGVTYQFYHTLALGIVVILAEKNASKWFRRAALCFVFGMILFCGSLYALALTGISGLGAITPLGGTLFLIGWASLGWAFFTPPKSPAQI